MINFVLYRFSQMWIAYRFLPLKGFISKYTLSAEKPYDLYYSLLLPVFLLIKDSQNI